MLEAIAQAILDSLPDRLFIALEMKDGREPTYSTEYARVPARKADFFLNGATITNGMQFEFPQARSDWGIIARICIYDAPMLGNERFSVATAKPKAIEEDDVLVIPARSIHFAVTKVNTRPDGN